MHKQNRSNTMQFFDEAIRQEKQRQEQETRKKAEEKLTKEAHDKPIIDSFKTNVTSSFLLFLEMAKEAPELFKTFSTFSGTRKRLEEFFGLSINSSGDLEYFYSTGIDSKGTKLWAYFPFDNVHFESRYFTGNPCIKIIDDRVVINNGEVLHQAPQISTVRARYIPFIFQNGKEEMYLTSGQFDCYDFDDSYPYEKHHYSLLYHLAKRTYTFSVVSKGIGNGMPQVIALDSLRPRSEIEVLLQEDFVEMAKGKGKVHIWW